MKRQNYYGRARRIETLTVLWLALVWLWMEGGVAPCWAGNPSKSQIQAANHSELSVEEIYQTKLFGAKCSGCHTVGHGKLVGPDLKDVETWPSDELTVAVKRMEKMAGPLKDDEIKSLVSFLKSTHADELIKKAEAKEVVAVVSGQPASALVGRQLFFGAERFANGGPSCMACHRAEGSGGTMGPDLSHVYGKFGESALVSACEQTNFKVMKAVYQKQPVTKQEALHLTKYFASINDSKSEVTDPPVSTIGFVGAGVFLSGLAFLYRRRNTGTRSKLNRR